MPERGLGAKEIVIGVDEAGRGPLAGPVLAAAVILAPSRPIFGLADSKCLSAACRERLSAEIRDRAVAWCVASATPMEIDALNILQATLLAMRRALDGLAVRPDRILVDGNRLPDLKGTGVESRARAIVRGDVTVPAISAASILAKVARDAVMAELELRYPGYGFACHKGYPTAAHRQALLSLGPSPVHRHSFAPVREAARA